MKNPFVRFLIWLFGALTALALISAGVLFFLVSRLDVRSEITTAVERATGRELTIAGDVGVSFYPALGLRAEQASLANVPGGRAPALAEIDELSIGVEIAPLFRREVVVRELVLERPRIFLEIDTEGAPNWVLQPAPSTAPPPPRPSAPATPLRLHEVRTIDGAVSYVDVRSNLGWSLSEANWRTSLESLDAPVRMRGSLVFRNERVGLDITIGAPRAAMAGQPTSVKAILDGPLIEADFEGQTTAQAGEMSGTISASGPSLRRLARWLGTPIDGGYGLENFSVAGALAIKGKLLSFSNAAFTLDALNGRGDFEVSELREKPYLSGRVELFDADFNPYISGQAPTPSPAPGVAAPASDAAPPAPPRGLDVRAAPSAQTIDFSSLRAINCDLEITAHQMRVQRMQIDGALLGLVVNDGFMAATLHRLELYGGTGRGRFELDAREASAKVVQEMIFDGVDAQRFLTDAANFSNIEGRAELSINLRTQGRTQAELISNADGDAHIEVLTGALRGVDLGGVSRTIGNAMSGDLVRPDARTPFQGFSAGFALADGVLASDNLSFNTSELIIRGLGLFNINTQQMDVRLAPRSVGVGIVTPFAVRGPIADLSYDSDFRDRVLRELQPQVRAVQAASRAS